MATPILPRPDAAPIGRNAQFTREWYDVFRSLYAFVVANDGDGAAIAEILLRLEALENAEEEFATIQGPLSVDVFGSLESGNVTVQLEGDADAPGNTYYYGTDSTGVKGWSTIASAVAGANSVVKSVAGTGVTTFQLDGDALAPGALFGYGTNMAGEKGWYRPALFESTGLLSGGVLSINGGDNTKFDISAAIVGSTDYSVSAAQPTRTVLSVGPFTAVTVASLAVVATYVGIQMPGGTIAQQSSPYTATQRRTIIPLGAVISNGVNLIAVNNLPDVMRAGINQIQDFMAAVGPMNLSGNVISANGAGLDMNKSAGTIFKQGSNFVNDPNNPHGLSLAGLTGFSFQYRLSNGTAFATGTVVDPNNYESPLGTLTAVPAANRFTIQRFTVFTSNLIRAQYGQFVYNTMAEAEASLSTEAFVTEQNIADNGILLCFLIVQDGATDLSDPTQAKFIPASKFGGPVGTGGTSITSTDSLPEGLVNLYYTDTRARAAVVTASITNGDTTHSPSGDAVFDALAGYLPAASVGNGLKIVANVLSAGESGTEDATTVLRGDGVWANRLDGPFGVGPQAPNILGFTNAITLSSATNCGYEMASSRADADGALIGAFTAIFLTNSVGHQRIADVQYSTDGATANQRGGSVRFFTKSDGSPTYAGRWRVRSTGHFEPEADATYHLGSASMRVANEYIGGARLETGAVSPAQLVANTDNWAVTGLASARVIRASTDASRNLTGIASPTTGQVVRLCNIGAFNLVLIHDATSTAANRFLCPNNAAVTLRPNGWVELWYDSTSSRWRVSGA